MKICILGNSVGFRIRPVRSNPRDMTYSEILELHGHQVRNVCRSAVMLNEAFAYLEEDVITFFPDIVILHYGIVEVAYRKTFRWANNQTIVNYYTNRCFARPYSYRTTCSRVRHVLFRAVNSTTRKLATLLGVQWQWLSTNRFLLVLQSVLELITKETRSIVIVIGVTPCTDRIENMLKGTRKNIVEVNAGIKTVCEHYSGRVQYLDPRTFIQESNIDEFIPDGIHFSAAGHKALAEELLRIIHPCT